MLPTLSTLSTELQNAMQAAEGKPDAAAARKASADAMAQIILDTINAMQINVPGAGLVGNQGAPIIGVASTVTIT